MSNILLILKIFQCLTKGEKVLYCEKVLKMILNIERSLVLVKFQEFPLLLYSVFLIGISLIDSAFFCVSFQFKKELTNINRLRPLTQNQVQ